MAILTISRELAALGDETAGELANLLQYRFVNKQALEARMKQLGGNEREIEKYDERKPAFFAALSHDRDSYLHYLKSAIFAEAGQGNCVFIGRGCGAILKGLPGVLSVFLAAPVEIRVERVKGYFHCDERRARQIIEHSDRDREGFHRYFFDMKWKNPAAYNLTLNTGTLHPELCAGLIKNVLEKTIDAAAEARNALLLKDLILSQELVRRVLFEKNLHIHFFEAQAASGEVTLFGVADSQAIVESTIQIIREHPEVHSVKTEIQVVREFSIVP